jgi:hypothetical protein
MFIMNPHRDDPHQRERQQAQQLGLHANLLPLVPVDPTMALTELERGWALDLKRALSESERFENTALSDMEIAEHAIVAKGNVVEAMVRIGGMEQFREEYGVTNSLEQIMTAFSDFMKQQPGYILHVDLLANQQSILALDLAAFSYAAAFQSSANKTADENWKTCVCATYFLHWALQPSIASMRHGNISALECDGFGWNNINLDFVRRLFEELMGYMPVHFHGINVYNTNVVANLMFSMAKPFMNQNMKRTLQLGLQVDEYPGTPTARRLSELYSQPNLEAAQVRVLQRIRTLAMLRLVKDQQFRL